MILIILFNGDVSIVFQLVKHEYSCPVISVYIDALQCLHNLYFTIVYNTYNSISIMRNVSSGKYSFK